MFSWWTKEVVGSEPSQCRQEIAIVRHVSFGLKDGVGVCLDLYVKFADSEAHLLLDMEEAADFIENSKVKNVFTLVDQPVVVEIDRGCECQLVGLFRGVGE